MATRLTPCPLCGAQASFLFSTRDNHSPESFDFYRCSCCTVEFIANPPADMRPYYENESGEVMRSGSSIFSFLHSKLMDIEFAPVLKPQDIKKVCVLGAGSGSEVSYLLKKNYELRAVDFQPVNDRHHIVHQANLNDSEEIKNYLETQKIDLVSLRHVLEHLQDPRATMLALQSGKVRYVNIIVPNGDSIFKTLFGQFWSLYDPPRHLFVFNRRSLEQIVSQTNYEIIYVRHYGNDEIFTSFYRYISLRFGEKKFARIFMAKSLLSSLFSAISFPFGKSSIQVVLKLRP